jgi:hypothetical protein
LTEEEKEMEQRFKKLQLEETAEEDNSTTMLEAEENKKLMRLNLETSDDSGGEIGFQIIVRG